MKVETGSQTRERIIRTAEVLFAKDGYAATSLRQITEAAGVNVAAVNYHFGSKESLLIEILDRVIRPINEKRIEMLDSAQAHGIPDLKQVMTAFLMPDLMMIEELTHRDPALPRFVSRMYSEGSEVMNRVMGLQFAETRGRFFAAFEAAVPDLEPVEVKWRLNCVVGIIVYLFAGIAAPGTTPMLTGDIDRDLDRLLTVTMALMSTREEVVAGSNT